MVSKTRLICEYIQYAPIWHTISFSISSYLFQPEVIEVMEKANVKNLRLADSNEEALQMISGK